MSFFFTERSIEEDDIVCPITSSLDPTNRFLTNNTFDEHSLVVPNIRNEDGFLITPDEYQGRI